MNNKPIALIITDSHFNKDNHDQVNEVLDQAIERAEELGVEYIFHCGDVFTDRTGRKLVDFSSFNRFLTRLYDRHLKLYIIPGNHDKTNLDSNESYLDVYDKWPGVTVVNQPWLFQLSPNCIFAFLPFYKKDKYKEELKKLTRDINKKYGIEQDVVLLTHQAIDGVRNNDGSIVKKHLAPKIFSRFNKVFVGHYHDRQSFGNIHYIGSLLPQNFGEDNEKGWAIVYDNFRHDLENAEFKKFLKVKVDLDSPVGQIMLQKMIKKHQSSNDNVRIIVKGKPEQLVTVNKNEIKNLGLDVKLDNSQTLDAMVINQDKEVEKLNSTSLFSMFNEWMDLNELSPDRQQMGINYIKKCGA